MTLPIEAVKNISLALEALVYGLYVSGFFRCSTALLDSRRRRVSYSPLIGVSLSLFAIGTVHFIVGLYLNVRDVTRGFAAKNTVPDRLRDYLYIIATLIANGFMVYRCFMIWNKKRRVILIPSILCLADFVLGTWLAVMRGREGLPSGQILMLSRLFCSLTLAINLTISSIIASRIWNIQREVSRLLERESCLMRRAATLVIESGALYSILLIALLTSSYASSAASRILYSCVVPFLGLIISAIIHRIGRGISHGDTITSVPVEFRNSILSASTTKGAYPSPSNNAPDFHRLEIPLAVTPGDRLRGNPDRRIDLNN